MARILVIDDDAQLGDLLRTTLGERGHDVDVAVDGVEAYERVYVAQATYDLVLCDLEMPRMPGSTFLRMVENQLKGRTPVVIVTGADRMLDALGQARRWAFGVLKKPFELGHLHEIVDHALQQREHYDRTARQARRIEELEARIRDLVKQNQSLFQEARLDSMTMLPNRRRLHEDLGRMVANVDRYERPFALCLLDVDDFRRYNEEQGYAGGDEAIRRVADLLRAAVRQGDTVYRFGGDEFIVVMQAQDLEQALRITERLRREIEEGSAAVSEEGDEPDPITISAGVVAVVPGEERSITGLVRRADIQLRIAKAAGGNAVYPRGVAQAEAEERSA
ncbi:MAG: diguanylate cyclase [Planctomycetota bacterium]